MTHDALSDERLRAALARRSAGAAAGPACPEAGLLWDLASGAIPAVQARDIAAHAVGCPACREALRLAREAGATAGAAAPAAGRAADAEDLGAVASRAGVARRPRFAWLAAAAILVVVAGSVLVIRNTERPAPPEFRDEETVRIEALAPVDPARGGNPVVLRWTQVEGARYDLTLAREDLEVLSVVRGIAAAEYDVPQDLLHRLPPGGRLLWQVEATLADGRRIRSGTFSVRFE